MKKVSVKEHYEMLLKEGNDPVLDPPLLEEYMDKWDGQAFINALCLSPAHNVLEIGVGTGRLAKKVLRAGCGHFTGIDLSPATITRARENLQTWQNVTLVLGDFLTHDFSHLFDIVYSSLTLFHFQDKKALINKVAQVMTAQGRVVLSIPQKPENRIIFADREVELYPDDPAQLQLLLKENGFTVCPLCTKEFAYIIAADKS